MDKINHATQYVWRRLQKSMETIKETGEGIHPFDVAQAAHEKMGCGTTWDDHHRDMATEGIAKAVHDIVATSCTNVTKEIATLGSFASNSDDPAGKSAANEMLSSMEFVVETLKSFLESVDYRYIAEQLFEEGYAALQKRIADKSYVPGAGVIGKMPAEVLEKASKAVDAIEKLKELVASGKEPDPADAIAALRTLLDIADNNDEKPKPAAAKPRWSTGFSAN